MELRYTFDSQKYYLGKLCTHGHKWPGTEQSLRRLAFNSLGQLNGNVCIGCSGRKKSDWLISFLDYEAMGWPFGQTLGKLCPKEHKWNDMELSLRLHGRCQECDKQRKRNLSPEKRLAKNIKDKARRDADPEYNNKRKEYQRLRWEELKSDPERLQEFYKRKNEGRNRIKRTIGRPARAAGLHGLIVPPGFRLDKGRAKACRALIGDGVTPNCPGFWEAVEERFFAESVLKAVGRFPSVARLVMNEQQRYWREHPKAKREHDRQWKRSSWWLRYQTDPDRRLYVRQKSKRRKALLRKQVAHQIKPKHLSARFAQFDNCCAYCGAAGDMQIEHVVPISTGGTHAIGNIVPACQTCNYSKRDHEVEWWYRAQPQFSEKRWRKICQVLGWDRSAVNQLALL